MISGLLLGTLLTLGADQGAEARSAVQKYVAACEASKSAAIRAGEERLQALEAAPDADKRKVEATRAQLEMLRAAPAARLPLRLPPTVGEVGIIAPPAASDGRGGRSADVLEVVDDDEAIVRLWYLPAPSDKQSPPEDPTFVDVWVRGLDARSLKVRQLAELPQVFFASGTRSFDTTCGGRSMILLEVVDTEKYR